MTDVDELILLFRAEATEQLGRAEEILQRLFASPSDQTALDDARKIIHNLKGAAQTVGAQRMVEPCEAVELEMKALASTEAVPHPTQIDGWLRSVIYLRDVLKASDVASSAFIAAAARAGAQACVANPEVTDTPPVETVSASRRILVVDDSIIVRTVVAQSLEAVGFGVTACADGEEAWASLAEQACDLVICDVQMPNLDGFGLTSRIRASAAHRGLPVILLTGQMTPEDVVHGAEVGADAYVTKDDLENGQLTTTAQRLLLPKSSPVGHP